MVLGVEDGAAVSGRLIVKGAHDVTVTGETMAANEVEVRNISGDLTLTATGAGGKAIGQEYISAFNASEGERAFYIGGSRENETFLMRVRNDTSIGGTTKGAYISIRKAPTYPVTVRGGELSNSDNDTTFYKGETVGMKNSRPEKGLKFNRWVLPDGVEAAEGSDPTYRFSFSFIMPDGPVEVTADWEMYTGDGPTLFWDYYYWDDVITPDNTPKALDGTETTVEYDPASRTYRINGDIHYWATLKGTDKPNIQFEGVIDASLNLEGANNVSIAITEQEYIPELFVDSTGTLTLENKTGTTPLEVELTYTQAEGAGYTVTLDGETLEDAPTYKNTTVKVNKSLTIVPNISDPVGPTEPDVPDAAGGDSDAAGALVAAAAAGVVVFGGYTIVTELMLQELLPQGAAIPQNQAELAKLIWQTAGCPEPAKTSAFAEVTDPETAKAAQWCVEQGYLDADFAPDKWTPKFKVIQAWNKAFPEQ